jgi:hypothetical protein
MLRALRVQIKIGLGLHTTAAMVSPPHPNVHPEEQMTTVLAYHPSLYSTVLVQRVVAQLVNRNLVAASELTHAFIRAQRSGCRPGPCFTSVEAALSGVVLGR